VTTAVVKKCDVCAAIIPGKLFEVRAVLILHDNGDSREKFARAEVCGASCYMASLSELMRTVTEPVPEMKADREMSA
jgi:hypothetical protein